MIEKHIQKLSVNPFLIGLIFQSFYEGYGKASCPILLHYLVTPLILYKESRSLFSTITKNASLNRIINENEVALVGLQERVWKTKELSNLSLISLHNQKKIRISNDVDILVRIKYEDYSVDFKTMLRSSHYLGILFSDIEVLDIFKIFKVIP